MRKATKLSAYKLFYEQISIRKPVAARYAKNRPKRAGRFLSTPKNILDNVEA